LVPIVGFGSLVVTEYAVRWYFHDAHYYQHYGWPKLAGFWLGASIIAGISRSVNEQENRELFDPKTGRTVVVGGQRHTFLWVPLKYWPAVLFVLGLVFLFVTEP